MTKFLKINNYYPNLLNKNKYVGDKKIITVRSSYELIFIKNQLDTNENVVAWSNEEYIIPYEIRLPNNTIKNKKYIVDFYVKKKNNKEYLIEIKPYKDTIPPDITKYKNLNSYKYQQITYMINQLKWEAAKKFCQNINNKYKDRNIEFIVITENCL